MPEFEESRVEHDEDAADVSAGFFHRGTARLRRVEVFCRRAVAIAAKKFHRHERIEEIRDGARVELQFRAELRPSQVAICELGENTKLDGCEQDFGRPKRKGGLKNGVRRMMSSAHVTRMLNLFGACKELSTASCGLRRFFHKEVLPDLEIELTIGIYEADADVCLHRNHKSSRE
jgi:hypothetical protein